MKTKKHLSFFISSSMAQVGEMATELDDTRRRDVIDAGVDDEEELGDLFGEDEDEEMEGNDNGENGDNLDDVDAGVDAAEEAAEEGAEESSEEVPFQEAEPLLELDAVLARHPRPHGTATGLSFPLPRFLSVNAEPFNPMEFEGQIGDLGKDASNESLKSSLQFRKMELVNTLRWRYAKGPSGSLHKQSNAHVVEWEDGSRSLKVGSEYFDLKVKPNADDILGVENELGAGALMGVMPLDQSVQVVPPSTKSQAHKLLAMTIKSGMRQKRAKKINTIVTNEDPEAKAREVERAQREVEKARRRQAQREEMEEAEQERHRAPVSYEQAADDEDDDDYEGNGDADGFVVNDEESQSEMEEDELDRAAEKLKAVKRAGAEKYAETSETSEASASTSVPAADADDDDAEDSDSAPLRKKRRVVLEEDDD